jgi:hypothetical protein
MKGLSGATIEHRTCLGVGLPGLSTVAEALLGSGGPSKNALQEELQVVTSRSTQELENPPRHCKGVQ